MSYSSPATSCLAPEVSLIITVAGDPRSPYRMDLQVPQAGSAPIS